MHECRSSLNEDLPAKHHMGWRRVVYNFTPAWFSVVMGTGMVSTILYTLPYNGRWLYWISIVIFAVNIGIFAACCLLSFLRYTMYPETFKIMLTQPAQSMFLSTIPLGLATIVNMICYVCVPVWGYWVEDLAWALWIVDASLSILSALCLPFSLMSQDVDAQLSSMTAIWLLPIVTCVVTSGTGAIVAGILSNTQHALWTIVASYVLWGVGICLAMMVYVIYFQRLTMHKLPHKGVIMSVFLPMGPLGSGSFGAMKLAESAKAVFSITYTFRDSSAASIVYVFGAMTALILWAFGLPWLFFAFASILKSGRFPFNIGWWAFTFPVGAYAMATCQLGKELPSAFFRVLGTILSLVVVIHWAVVSVGTLGEVITGNFFITPGPDKINQKQEGGNDPEDIA
ncbi:TDT family transporter [Aspergillus clavatus NRRL 1]|uniref:C4-dicarboxylate/malic acid transporter, putative n=1 Tax=Aspergillus clavatus (strain ATCC 1007 / CBS 513.65 / DSM 816 / NCTC 3887 / NRRL 1 / QM 1276 / 107) TaxID=344612 RepID=A1CPC2_ASPCL|nr:C4-dicarboxylate/malic acid transporter, putative [Aspergillus clavatus NRRL 1]EAW07493.1 C4-dicarboxylate/malic acid transporter, putative [Aspergillus clavatus NRRL 1]